jgi:hypothetical protein
VKPTFDAMTIGARNIIAAMQRHGVRRLITLTGAGVPDANDRPTVVHRFVTFLLKIMAPRVLADATSHVEQVRASGLEWTIVRASVARDGARTGRVRVGWVGGDVGAVVRRADIADFMLRQLTDQTYVHEAPAISN